MKKTYLAAMAMAALLAFSGCSSQSNTTDAASNQTESIQTETTETEEEAAETGQAGAEATADTAVLTGAMKQGDVEKAITMNIPASLEDYLSLEPISEEDSSTLLVRFTNGEDVANIGTLGLSTITDYEELKEEGLPVGDEILRDEDAGVVLTYSGMQDSVFEPDTENYDLVMEYDAALDDVLASITME